jgi:DNA-binding MarR family transcriptional regulator
VAATADRPWCDPVVTGKSAKTLRSPTGDAEPPEIEKNLRRKPGYLIRRLQQTAVSFFLEETSDFQITPIQYATLAVVCLYPGSDQLRVANAIGIDRTTIGGVVQRIEAKKLIVRKVSVSDRRANLLYPTARGTRLLASMEGATNRVHQRILAPLSVEEQNRFLQCLNRLVIVHNHSSRVPVDRALLPSVGKTKVGRFGRGSAGGESK